MRLGLPTRLAPESLAVLAMLGVFASTLAGAAGRGISADTAKQELVSAMTGDDRETIEESRAVAKYYENRAHDDEHLLRRESENRFEVCQHLKADTMNVFVFGVAIPTLIRIQKAVVKEAPFAWSTRWETTKVKASEVVNTNGWLNFSLKAVPATFHFTVADPKSRALTAERLVARAIPKDILDLCPSIVDSATLSSDASQVVSPGKATTQYESIALSHDTISKERRLEPNFGATVGDIGQPSVASYQSSKIKALSNGLANKADTGANGNGREPANRSRNTIGTAR